MKIIPALENFGTDLKNFYHDFPKLSIGVIAFVLGLLIWAVI